MTRTAKQISAEIADQEAKLNALRREHTETWACEQAAIPKTMTCGRWAESAFGPPNHYWRDDRTCSYCGSLHPDDVFAAIEAGELLGPTDKSYKLYVHPHRKFYFQHFDDAQQTRFIELLNAKKVKLGVPGYFYRLPFFIESVPKGQRAEDAA